MKTHINLLPRENRRSVMLRIRGLQWGIMGCVAIAAGVTFGWAGYREHMDIEEELDRHTRTYEPIVVMEQELNKMKTQIDTLARREKMAAEMVDQHPALTLLGVLSRTTQQCKGRLKIGKLTLGRPGERGLDSTLVPSRASQLVLISGTALDIASVTRFVDALRDADVFTEVDMKPTKETTVGNRPAFAYDVECAY